MSTIEDLEIRGVRNFGDESSKSRIHFTKPLTLILGPNGTGKTTIIESLKFITSGEYPPDSERGKSFVHEPKLNHTVRGQVKARVRNKHGKELIISRTMQVSRQKTGALKFQALDNTITHIDEKTKEKQQITNRCADIDQEMLNAMGVSKPILNYVIFCHQEESNWPLEDGKKLKDRFDEIFDTSQYNKAMDESTKFIKDLQSDLNTLKARESGLKAMVGEVESQEEKLKDYEKREQEAKDEVVAIDESLKPIEEKITMISDVKVNFDKLEVKKRKLDIDYDMTNAKIMSLQRHIKEVFRGTKDELIGKLETYDTNLSQKDSDKKQYAVKLKDVERLENELLRKLENAKIQMGSLTQKKFALDEKIGSRNQLLTKVLQTWEISQFDDAFTEQGVQDQIDLVERKFNEFESAMKSKFRENEQAEKHVQREVDEFRTEKTGIESEMKLKEKEQQELKLSISQLKAKIKEAGEAGNRLNIVETNLENATKNYDTIVQSFDEDSLKEKLQTTIAKKKDVNVKLGQIDDEIDSIHQLTSQQNELEFNQNRLKKEEETITALKTKHLDNLNLLFDDEIPQKKLKENLEIVQKSLNNEKNNLTRQIDEEKRKVTKLETLLKCNKKELTRTTAELEGYKKRVDTICKGQDYTEILGLQEEKVKSLQDKRGVYANQSIMYKEYIRMLKKKSCCPLCERGFQNSAEEVKLEKKLLLEMEKSPELLDECEKDLNEEKHRYEELQSLKSVIKQIEDIENNKLPKLKGEVEKTEKELKSVEENLDSLGLVLSEPEEKLNIYKTIVGDIALLDSHINQKDNLYDIIENKKREMSRAGKIGNRSLQEAQNEREALKKRLTSVEHEIEQSQLQLQAGQEKVQKAREQKNKLNEEVIHIRQSMQEEKKWRDKLNESYDRENILEDSVRGLRKKSVVAEDQLAEKIKELQKLKQKNRDEQDKDANFKTKCTTEMHELKLIQQEVQRLVNMKIEDNLQEVENRVDRIKEDSGKKKEERIELEERIRALDEELRSQERRKEELGHNLELINAQEYQQVLKDQISEIEKEMEKLEFDKLKAEYQQMFAQREELEKKKNTIKGSLSELENGVRTLKKDLNQEKYRMARRNYQEGQLELSVQEEAIENLKEYVRVLDEAMIRFHEERMDTVNAIMRQLWNLVYSGNDTSAIQIRVNTTGGIGDKKRSYNYKLVQVKRAVEMDMKGRCSAGQKVLASIIIRMALAEAFCSECPILALDEPTTNLDQDNAMNLARTLSRVIQLRAQHQVNFQLIVISHDEKFISQLSNLSGKQVFHELYRNIDGYSLIRKRDITDYIRNSSQGMNGTHKVECDSEEEEDEDGTRFSTNSKDPKKRCLSLEDSPPMRASKRKA